MEYRVEKYIVVEILEKAYRLRKFINLNKSFFKDDGNKGTVEVFEKVLNKILFDLEDSITTLKFPPLRDTEKIIVNRRLSNILFVIKEFHYKLKYIYADWVRPETYTFTKRLVQQHLPNYISTKINIVLADEYTFKENNLIKKFNEVFLTSNLSLLSEEVEYPTLFLPKIEFNNPLNWSILAHELGHIDNKLIKDFLQADLIPPDTTNENKKILYQWAEEIYCDIFAVNLLGPAYFASFVSFAIVTTGLGGNCRNSKTHPSNMTRIRILHEYLRRNKSNINIISEEFGTIDMQDFFHRMIEDFDRIDRKIMNVDIPNNIEINNLTYFTDAITDKSKEYGHLLEVSNEELKIIELLRGRLEKGITIGSYPDYDKKIMLENLKDFSKDFDETKRTISEKGASIKQILTAGWVNKISYHFTYMNELIFNSDKVDVLYFEQEYGKLIDKSDDRLLKSIESSELFYLIEN